MLTRTLLDILLQNRGFESNLIHDQVDNLILARRVKDFTLKHR